LLKVQKTNDGRQMFNDYGFCYASINGVGGVMFSGNYIRESGMGPLDKHGEREFYTEPVYRDTFSNLEGEAFGFINQ
jgi:hypothetical protein